MIIEREIPLKVGDLVRITIPEGRSRAVCPDGINRHMLSYQGKTAVITDVYSVCDGYSHNIYHLRFAGVPNCWSWNDAMLTEIKDSFKLDADKATALI